MGSLVLWELGKKQTYIFNSNKLKDAIGASLIIKDFSEDYYNDLLKEENFITRGGGKTIYYFESKDEGREFIKNLSFHILKNYPGLELLITSVDMDFKKDNLKDKISEIYKKLDKKKNSKKNSLYQMGFGIERRCSETGLISSIKENREGSYISNEIRVKREYCDNRQGNNFQELIPKGYKLEVSLDDLAKDGGKQYTGVIHIDGNGMGKKITEFFEKIERNNSETQEEFNHRYKRKLCRFSEEISKRYKEAFAKMCKVIEKTASENSKLSEETKINDSSKDGKYKGSFPLRPLILAGDDITYVCNASIAIESARVMLEILEKEVLFIDGDKFGRLNSCAGVAITKKGYSFKRAYELAEELCSSAKTFLLERNNGEGSAIDFQFLQGDCGDGLESIRAEYVSKSGEILTMKPLLISSEKEAENKEATNVKEDRAKEKVTDKKEEIRTYENFLNSLEYLNRFNEDGVIARSKIKLMKSAFFEGRDATERFFKFYKIPEYTGALVSHKDNYGFSEDGICLFLDGMEVMDFFIPLNGKGEF
ncbi:hypothetical protein ACQR22_02025 [Clostridium perfringens]|uniref:hypothetical protein n=1 Tax=Clostridium perfringens TaxID=1502 RepID=UPI001F58140D|nr:hypothetical protein [Clostridium perfringens]MCI2779027.1 hypothetical protein [Clostridium perfringens]